MRRPGLLSGRALHGLDPVPTLPAEPARLARREVGDLGARRVLVREAKRADRLGRPAAPGIEVRAVEGQPGRVLAGGQTRRAEGHVLAEVVEEPPFFF